MFQLMKYSNKGSLRAINTVFCCDLLSVLKCLNRLWEKFAPSPFALFRPGFDFIKSALNLGMSRDGSSRGIFWCAMVKPEGVIRNYTPQGLLPFIE